MSLIDILVSLLSVLKLIIQIIKNDLTESRTAETFKIEKNTVRQRNNIALSFRHLPKKACQNNGPHIRKKIRCPFCLPLQWHMLLVL